MHKHIYNELDVSNLRKPPVSESDKYAVAKYEFHYSVGAIRLDQQRSEDYLEN